MGQDRKPSKGAPDLRKKAEASLQSKTPDFQELSLDEMSVLVHELQVHQIELEMQNDELRRGQIALEEANNKYSHFYDFAPVGFLTLDESGIIREINLTAANQIGVTRSHLVDKPCGLFIEVDDRDRFRRCLTRVFQEPGPQHCEIRLQRPDGGRLFARLDSIAVTDVSGKRVCRTSITDISDLKQAEQKLHESERLFAAFMEHLPSVAVIRDLQGRYLFANAAWEQAFRKSREEWRGKTSEELWPPEVAAKFKAQDRLVMESGAALQTLGSLPHPDGPHQWIAYRFPIVDQDGQPVMIGINAIDVTEAMETKARLEQVLTSSPAAIYTIDPGRNFALSYLSDNIETLVGWEFRDFLADPRFWLDHVHPEDRPRVCKRLELPWPEDRQTYEYRFLAKDGAYRWIHDDSQAGAGCRRQAGGNRRAPGWTSRRAGRRKRRCGFRCASWKSCIITRKSILCSSPLCLRSRTTPVARRWASGCSMPPAKFLTRPLMVSASNSMNRQAPYPSEPISACVLT